MFINKIYFFCCKNQIENGYKSESINAEIDQCVFLADVDDVLNLGFINDDSNDSNCQTRTVVDGVHTVSAHLDACGTTVLEAENGELEFTNTVTVLSRDAAVPGIALFPDVNIPLHCMYSSTYTTDTTTVNVGDGETGGSCYYVLLYSI